MMSFIEGNHPPVSGPQTYSLLSVTTSLWTSFGPLFFADPLEGFQPEQVKVSRPLHSLRFGLLSQSEVGLLLCF